MTNRWKNQALDAGSLLWEMTVLTSRLRQEKGSTQLTTLWTSGTWKNRLDVQALHSLTSSELSVWVFTTSLWGRDFCPHLTHKEMWAEIQWLSQELTLATGSFYYTRLLFKLFENHLRQNIRELSGYPGKFVFQWILCSGFWNNRWKTKAQRVLKMSGWERPPRATAHNGEPKAGIEAHAKALRTRPA